jgi:DNA replication protein DnaC
MSVQELPAHLEPGYVNVRPEQANIFFKLMEERYRRHATIVATNLEYDSRHSFLGNRLMVDALLGRLRHTVILSTSDAISNPLQNFLRSAANSRGRTEKVCQL